MANKKIRFSKNHRLLPRKCRKHWYKITLCWVTDDTNKFRCNHGWIPRLFWQWWNSYSKRTLKRCISNPEWGSKNCLKVRETIVCIWNKFGRSSYNLRIRTTIHQVKDFWSDCIKHFYINHWRDPFTVTSFKNICTCFETVQ